MGIQSALMQLELCNILLHLKCCAPQPTKGCAFQASQHCQQFSSNSSVHALAQILSLAASASMLPCKSPRKTQTTMPGLRTTLMQPSA
jgi:hypothetical protein